MSKGTSTAIATDVQTVDELGRQCDVLVVVDGVCSVAGEELHQEQLGLDLALTGTQEVLAG